MSFAILRTNVGLTTNIKVMVDSNYSLSLSSIESKEELSNSKFKKVPFINKNYYDELVTYFYDGLPADIAFYIKYDNDVDTTSKSYEFQYDEIYQYGARNISNNKEYNEEFEYFAPLYISPNDLPSKFIIFRVDGLGIESINKDNFKAKILNNFKTIKIFDLSKSTLLGQWLDLNFNNNSFFPLTPFEMSFQNLEFSKWNGIDYENGGYASKSLFLETFYEKEKEIYEFEKFIFDGYKNNKVVFPNILNLSFLFDDTPANSDTLRKWSINRYFGFYLDDMVKVKTISPYITPFIKSDVVIQSDNILYCPSGDPFVEGFNDKNIYYVEYLGEYYKVEKFTETSIESSLQSVQTGSVVTQEYLPIEVTKYKIISSIDLTGKESLLNKNTGIIGDETTYLNRLLNYDGTNFTIDEWDTADVWIIEINGIYHSLVREIGPEMVAGVLQTTTRIRINSDYLFKVNENDYEYWINKSDPSYTTKVSFVVDANNPPKKFNIYKLKFTDIKDFDTKIVDTEYSKYEYENEYELTNTDETKMYLPNLYSKTYPKNYDDFIYNGEVINIPISSEYTANYETFKISNGELSQIWRRNPVYCRWGFQNSLAANDVPYLLNNSLLFEDYNRTANPFNPIPERIERNLDYFYTINSSTSSYIHHTLHVEDLSDSNFKFELDKYLNLGTYSTGTGSATYSYDYFTHFFEKNAKFDNFDINKNSKKYSLFNSSDKSIPNITVFRGIKFLIYDVDDIKKDDSGEIQVLNLKSSNTFDGYKFSILLSDNDYTLVDSEANNNSVTLQASQNLMNWTIFDEWKMDKDYNDGDIVVKDDILYKSATSSNITTNPVKSYSNAPMAISAPYNQDNWEYYVPEQCIFWSPTSSYPASAIYGSIIYNNKEYYYYFGGSEDFWNPDTSLTGYSQGDVVLFSGNYYMSMTSSNHYRPDYTQLYDVEYELNQSRSALEGTTVYDTVGKYYWALTQSSDPKWELVPLWNPSIAYGATYTTYVVNNEVVYSTTYSQVQVGNEPGISSDWVRVYSMQPDTNLVYNSATNSIIEMNNSYYLINSNMSSSTLDNGINIYINKKWKNILININISDNTIPGLVNTNRDDLYTELNEKLTAYNFIQAINDITNKYGFTDYVNYIIIDESGNIKKYNFNNIEGLPYYISCEVPDEVNMKLNSLSISVVEAPKKLKASKVLSVISSDLSNLNYYNKTAIAADIKQDDTQPKTISNLHRVNNIKYDTIYRFSGFYMPVFYSIDLFESPKIDSNYNLIEENYKFDTTLTNFGIIKERKIRKVNHKEYILKLYNDSDEKSIYPMLDEFGYTIVDSFIFKSTWDSDYHIFTSNNPNYAKKMEVKSSIISDYGSMGIQDDIKNINL